MILYYIIRRKLKMKFVLVKKALVVIIISTVFIAGLSTVYAGNIFNDNQELKNENIINNLIQSNLLSKEKSKIFDFLFGLISKTVGLTVFSIGAILTFIVGIIGYSIYENISEDMPLLKILTPYITGGIAGVIIGKCMNFAQKRLGPMGDAFVGLTYFIVFLLIVFLPFYYDYLPI